MKNILILTRVEDVHALVVQKAIEMKGHNCTLWYTGDFPTKQNISYSFKNNGSNTLTINGPDIDINEQHFDTVWNRRPSPPIISNDLHEADLDFVLSENMTFSVSHLWLAFEKSRWVNPYSSYARSNSKLVQLSEATKLGIKIPDTLISNEPEKIKCFITKYPNHKVIYKPFKVREWISSNGIALLHTNIISLDKLPSNDILRQTPGIYQQYIDKKYELRITYFGDTYIAVKLDSQNSKAVNFIDWRSTPTDRLNIEAVSLPPEIDEKFRQLMVELKIVFGCFDVIVTSADEYIFLEVNEMGQFLWMENSNPELHFLNTFCDFLINHNTSKSGYRTVNYNDVKDKFDISDLLHQQKLIHVSKIKEMILEKA